MKKILSFCLIGLLTLESVFGMTTFSVKAEEKTNRVIQPIKMSETMEITKQVRGKQGVASKIENSENAIAAYSEDDLDDLAEFSNTLENLSTYGTTTNSYLTKTDAGYQEVLADGGVHIIDFDNNWKQISERILDYELPIWGGYYSGETYNYLVFGQNGSSAGTEIYRIVKYDKEFKRLNSLSVLYEDCYTVIPFDAGNVSIVENGNELIIYTARTRPDGHQSNIALQINTDTMTISNKNGMAKFPNVHVSHSFREIVKYDGDNPVYVDLGDAYPREVCLQEKPGIYTTMLNIRGQIGDNYTDTDVSGLEITDTGYLVVGVQNRNYCNNIYLSYAEKGAETARVTWLTASTSYNYSNVCNAKIIKISDGSYAVMWNNHNSGGSVDYVMVNGQGELISERKSLSGAELTQCEPIFADGKVTWIKYKDGIRNVYSLTDFSCTGEYDWGDTYVDPVNPWDGSVDTRWYKAEKKTFTLTKPQQLAGLAQLVNSGNTFEGKKVLLGDDMFFNEIDSTKNSWIPIGVESSNVPFEGTFDGQGHVLYNMYIGAGEEVGLFGVIGEQGIVKAVTVSQSYMEGTTIAYINKGYILFCQNNSFVVTDGDSIVDETGGICCRNNNLIYGCGNNGVVIGIGHDAGGITGESFGNGATIDSCWNQGYVTATMFASAGIAANNDEWVYDCYNAGTIAGQYKINTSKTVAGIVGNQGHDLWDRKKIYNCYNTGYLDITDANWYQSDVIGGAGKSVNTYALASQYNYNATEVTLAELQALEAIKRLQGEKIIQKWCMDTDNLNNGCIIPIAQQDMKNGIYKMLPDVWNPITEVSIKLSDKDYQLEAFEYAYYGIDEVSAVYSSESDVLSITPEGVITPLKKGTATVHVTFEEAEHAKECGFDVAVTVTAMSGDVNGDGNVDSVDLRLILQYVCGKTQLTEQQKELADVVADGNGDSQDLRKILRYICGKVTEL